MLPLSLTLRLNALKVPVVLAQKTSPSDWKSKILSFTKSIFFSKR
jgi:hypothetical protein